MTENNSETTPANDIERRISPAAREQMRAAIREVEGDEVFFVGLLDEHLMVVEVEPVAFGNRQAVPAVSHQAQPGDVVIHNHPGGNLQPSDADLNIASDLGGQGIGTYIVDNGVERLRVVVRPMRPRERKPLDVGKLEDLLEQDGPLARGMSKYERRQEQADMLRTVAEAFNDDGIAVIEAGTGTGKSIAYLLPAIYWAHHNREKVVVSTNTINLQQQLIAKDIPFLKRHLGVEFEAVLMKGRNNYLCKRKAEYLRVTPDFFGDDRTTGDIEALLDWAKNTEEGSRSELSFIPSADAWEEVSCDADNCTRVRCKHYATCFFYEARRGASRADIIVANHHLVMADLALRKETHNYDTTAVLPAYRRIVLDEGHNVEDVATQYFGITITRRSLVRPLSRLVHRERRNFGLLPFLRQRLVMLGHEHGKMDITQQADKIESELIPARVEVASALNRLMDCCAEHVPALLRENLAPRRELKLRITPDIEETEFWWRYLKDAIDAVATALTQLVRGLRELHSAVTRVPPQAREEMENPAGELQSIANRLAARVDQYRNFYTIGENHCRWIEVYQPPRGSTPSVRLVSLPLEIQSHLATSVYGHQKTVVMTSATLSVDRQFDFFLGQVGLAQEQAENDVRERVVTQQLTTSFDYEKQAFVGIPTDMPEPRSSGFNDAAIEFLLPALQISEGSAFLLFTSYRQLNAFHGRLAPLLERLGYTSLKQGDDNRQALLQAFRNDRTSVLFATSSFWEGVDVPGDALRLLVLVKLPFRVPTDPLVQARAERLEEMGIDSFSAYTVPQAVIRFKQGFGRLIRTRDDTGAVLILDPRIASKRYGRVFLNSLPRVPIHAEPAEELMENLAEFFGR